MNTKHNTHESLAIISEMIDRARNNIQKDSGTSMIFWGSFISGIAILNIALLYTLEVPNLSFWVWTLTIPGFGINYFIQRKIDKNTIVKTHIDKIISSVWNGFTICIAIFIVIIFAMGLKTNLYQFYWLFIPIILLLAGFAEFVTAIATRFKSFLFASISMWTGSILSVVAIFMSFGTIALQFVIFAFCMITGFVIPGLKLNKKANI